MMLIESYMATRARIPGEPSTIMSTHVKFIAKIPLRISSIEYPILHADEVALPEIQCTISGKAAHETDAPHTTPLILATHVDRT